MEQSKQGKVAKMIASTFLVSCLAGGAITAVANADTMAPPMAKTKSSDKTTGNMMRHGCSGKSKRYKSKGGMMRHGCSGIKKKSTM
ncbi:hypothetical protein [Acidithiobacillus sp.]|uniref:hypothetical protein n=1 Tax=Acidithiobacillus sp. TaxID=1872118 RepID=UPI003D090490